MLAAGISVVVGQVIYQSKIAERMNSSLAAGIPAGIADTLAHGSSVATTFIIQNLTVTQQVVVTKQVVVKTALTNSLSKIWIFYTVISLAVLACFGIQKRELSRSHVDVKTLC